MVRKCSTMHIVWALEQTIVVSFEVTQNMHLVHSEHIDYIKQHLKCENDCGNLVRIWALKWQVLNLWEEILHAIALVRCVCVMCVLKMQLFQGSHCNWVYMEGTTGQLGCIHIFWATAGPVGTTTSDDTSGGNHDRMHKMCLHDCCS
jgi:hypothetical protein